MKKPISIAANEDRDDVTILRVLRADGPALRVLPPATLERCLYEALAHDLRAMRIRSWRHITLVQEGE